MNPISDGLLDISRETDSLLKEVTMNSLPQQVNGHCVPGEQLQMSPIFIKDGDMLDVVSEYTYLGIHIQWLLQSHSHQLEGKSS